MWKVDWLFSFPPPPTLSPLIAICLRVYVYAIKIISWLEQAVIAFVILLIIFFIALAACHGNFKHCGKR